MQHVMIKFCLCYLVVLGNGTPLIAPLSLRTNFNLTYNILVKRNHKGLTIENCHRFLSKSIRSTGKERVTNYFFVPVGIVAGYTWNSVPMDGTHIIRSIQSIDRELHFHIDINMNILSTMNRNNAQITMLNYLNFIKSTRHSFSSILKIFVEDRRPTYIERINNNRNCVVL